MVPPPRPQRIRPETPAKKSRFAILATVVGFTVLLAAGVMAFVLLPGWVESRQSGKARSQDALESSAEPAARPGGESAAETSDAGLEPVAFEDEEAEVDRVAEVKSSAPSSRNPRGSPPVARPRTRPVAHPDDAFSRQMTDGLKALERGDHAAARSAFLEAQALKPSSQLPADGLARLEEASRLAAIEDLRQEALAAEQNEQWGGAASRYEEILKLDSSLEFALDGRARSIERANLSSRLDAYLDRPDRLSSEEVLAEARLSFSMANEIEQPGARLERQRTQLAQLLQAYSTPVRAHLESDGQTEVIVYQVGRLGTFARRELELRPGVYTVVGTRSGYRDVRHRLKVEPGKEPPPLMVRCEERI